MDIDKNVETRCFMMMIVSTRSEIFVIAL